MTELLLTIGGAILGIIITVFYDNHKEKKTRNVISVLLVREMKGNIKALNDILTIIREYSGEERPDYITPLSLEEIANRIEKACRREAFDACYRDISGLGSEAMNKIFSFYNGFNIAETFREIERFAGNIRPGLFQDNIQHLIDKGNDAINIIDG